MLTVLLDGRLALVASWSLPLLPSPKAFEDEDDDNDSENDDDNEDKDASLPSDDEMST